MKTLLSLLMILMLCIAVPVQAGALFPPEGVANRDAPCPTGQVLSWTGGSLKCANPTPGVTVSRCSGNTVLDGISNGRAICQNPLSTLSVANCQGNKVMRGIASGQAVCSLIQTNKYTTSDITIGRCPGGKVMTGVTNGNARCEAVTPKVTTTRCPTNQVMVGISNGKPICEKAKGGFGGGYSMSRTSKNNSLKCVRLNPLTNACSCPSGFQGALILQANSQYFVNGNAGYITQYNYLYMCFPQ